MKRAILAAASLALLAACGPVMEDADHGVSTDPNAATGFITSNMAAPATATIKEGETVPRDADGRPYSYALLGKPLPPLSGLMADGREYDPASMKTWTIIDVWGIWCGDCMADGPYVAALVTAISQDPDLGFLSIHTPANANRATPEDMFGKYGSVSAYFEAKGYNYPTLIDEDASLREALQISWTPSYLLVDPEGIVRGFRTDLSVARGEPVKDFLKDVARVKAEHKKAGAAPPRQHASIGPDGVMGLSGAIAFNTTAIRAAFSGYEVVPGQSLAEGQTHPVFNIVSETGSEIIYTIEPDWALGRVRSVSTTHPGVAGPQGELVGQFRLEELGQPERETCVDGQDASSGLILCNETTETAMFQRVFKPLENGSGALLAGMAYYPDATGETD